MINKKRLSGVLLPPTSFPGPYGIGDLGPEAYKFVDFLAATGQSLWQVLPLGPTGYGDSPYACFSAFAGNTLLVSPDNLLELGLLDHADLAAAPDFKEEERVDFERAHRFKAELLTKAFERFKATTDTALRTAFLAFCQRY